MDEKCYALSISTTLQRLSMHVLFIAELHMERHIFANSTIPEKLFQFVLCLILLSLQKGTAEGKKKFVNSPPYFSEIGISLPYNKFCLALWFFLLHSLKIATQQHE